MPLYGTLKGLAPKVDMNDLSTEPRTLERVDVLQVMYEIDSAPMLDLLPAALHPTIPPTVTVIFWRAQEFTLCQVRVGCRAGARPRGFPVAGFIDNESEGRTLASQWGYLATPADVRLRRGHYKVSGTVTVDGRTVVDAELMDPEAISGGDIQYTASMNLARVGTDPLLVQVDPDYTFHKADRGRPDLRTLDVEGTGTLVYPVAGSITTCDITLPRIRYVSNPDVPAMQGTRKVG